MRLAVLTSHPIQYYAPLFRELARQVDLRVFFAHNPTPEQQADAGFGVPFDWDVDLLSGYEYEFLPNVARAPGVDAFLGCDTPIIANRLRRGAFDALLVTGWNLKSYWQGVWAAKICGIRVVARGDSHLETPRGLARRVAKHAAYPALLRTFDAAAYVGDRNLSYWRHYGYPPQRLFFSPHSVDNSFFSARATDEARNALRTRLGINDRTRVALFAGRLVQFKRPGDLLSAAAILRRDGADLHVLVAGSGELEPMLRQQSHALKVPAHFLGFQNQSEMPAGYAASDVLVLPSDSRETWGLVANEALACGRPIVVSDACGCAPDLAADSLAGRMARVGDIQDLASALRQVLHARPSSHSIREKVRAYSIETAAKGVMAAINRAPILERAEV